MVRLMQSMDNSKQVLKVIGHVILKPNYWEYYVLAPEEGDSCDDDLFCALVQGFESEIGYCSWSELKPYIMTSTKNLAEIMPAIGYRWIE